jgi:hypothetical protein
MALIRQVLKHPSQNKWAYIEYSDESSTYQVILGHKEFDAEEEADEWAKGFEPFSYSWQDLETTKRENLLCEKANAEKKLQEINSQLNEPTN